MIEITQEYLRDIKRGAIHHKYYDETVKHAKAMGVHVEAETPKELLEINRPNEDEEVKKYRLESYQPVTTSLSEKVINTVNKVFNPRLYSFEFPEMNTDESLEQYLTEGIPIYRSLMNFVTETFTQKDFSDPNGTIAVVPKNFEIEDTERFEPIPIVYRSEDLKDFKDDEYYTYYLEDTIKIFTRTQILVYKELKNSQKQKWELHFEYNHDFGTPPVFRLGGVVKGKYTPYYFFSWMAGVLPHWNQVVTLTSDLHANYVNHLHQHKWEFATDCDHPGCNGGKVTKEIFTGGEAEVIETNCPKCNGSGKITRGPYGVHTINRDAINPDSPLPTPPFGFESPDISVVDKVENRIKDEEKRGLASINMEIVQMVGEDQSGVAKTVDREDLNTFLSRYSRHVFEYVLPNLIYYIAAWRYGETNNLEDILPTINQPKDFNILTLNQLTEEYKNASTANVSDNYLSHLEREIVQAKFANNEDMRLKNETIISLNPYPGKSVDDLLTLKNIGEPDWKIYKFVNLVELVTKAIELNEGFLDLELSKKRKVIDQMAKDESGFSDTPVVVVPPQRPQQTEENFEYEEETEENSVIEE